MIWCCPACHGALLRGDARLRCSVCGESYDQIDGIPDLRQPGRVWIDLEEDSARARRLVEEMPGASAADLVRRVFRERPGWDAERIELRTEQVLSAPKRLERDVEGWLRPCFSGDGPFLDVGCGPGMLGAAAGRHPGLGIDVSMTWLVVAKRLIAECGGRPVLAAALAETLPLPTASVGAVVSLDVIEHVDNPMHYLAELNRVTRPGGWLALATPNRFSLTAEPHVGVWGVGWIPRPLQAAFVRWRSGRSYESTRLLSSRELADLVEWSTRFDAKVIIPEVAPEELLRFPPLRARVARIYNRLAREGWLRWLFLGVGPFFRVVGQKRAV